MSDTGRKGFGEQAQEKMTPDSTKSTTDKIGENVSGAADRVAGGLQPEGEKSTTQKAGDSVRGGSDDASGQGKSMLDSAKDAMGMNK